MRAAKNTIDFIVIGAQKAGTTALFEYLKRHPELSLPASKEMPFFSYDAHMEQGWADYMDKAAFVGAERKWGTITPQYMVGGVLDATGAQGKRRGFYDERTVPLRIRKQLPDVRLIAVLRDPVERTRSHHQMAVMDGFERRSFADAVADLLSVGALEDARRNPSETTGYVAWSEYGRVLSGYFDVFPREQLLVVFTNELERAPAELLRRVQAFIGVRSDFVPDNLGARYRSSGAERRFSWMSPYASLSPQGLKLALAHNERARAVWARLPANGQLWVRRRYEAAAYRVDLWNRRGERSSGEPDSNTVVRLREHFASDADRLTALMGAVPPWVATTV